MRTALSLAGFLLLTASATAVIGTPAFSQPALDFTAKHPGPDPTLGLPPGSSVISDFGERAAFSPDGSKIAFVADYDAFEFDRATGLTRNLTDHIPHKTILRIQYLADGNYLISGFHNLGKLQFATRDETRKARTSDTELFFMSKKPGAPMVRLNAYLHEGYAQSRTTNKIAWVDPDPRDASKLPAGTKVTDNMYIADVKVAPDGLHASLVNKKLVKGLDVASLCSWEPQDFRNNDTEIVAPCYMTPATPGGKIAGEKIVGVNIASGALTTYYTKTNMYAEIEGTSADGKWALIECGPVLGGPLDLCRFDFTKGPDQTMARVTFGQDYGPYKISNPVVTRDGKWAAAQLATLADDAGTGNGIVLIKMPPP